MGIPDSLPSRLRPIDLGGGVVIDTPVILAPMSGVTDLPFRRLARELGATDTFLAGNADTAAAIVDATDGGVDWAVETAGVGGTSY